MAKEAECLQRPHSRRAWIQDSHLTQSPWAAQCTPFEWMEALPGSASLLRLAHLSEALSIRPP